MSDHDFWQREVAALMTLQRARQNRDEGTGDAAAVDRARNEYVAAMVARDRAAAAPAVSGTTEGTSPPAPNTETVPSDSVAAGWRRAVAGANARMSMETASTEPAADIVTEPARAGWARAVAEANRGMLARYGSADAASAVPAGPANGGSSGWAKAIAGANSDLHPGAIRNGGAVSPGSGA